MSESDFRWQATFSVSGSDFKPSRVKAPYSFWADPGALGMVGKYRDAPTPYGHADFEVPANANPIPYLHRLLVPLLSAFKESGAEDFSLRITYYYRYQCALGFGEDELKMLSELHCTFAIDCIKEDE